MVFGRISVLIKSIPAEVRFMVEIQFFMSERVGWYIYEIRYCGVHIFFCRADGLCVNNQHERGE